MKFLFNSLLLVTWLTFQMCQDTEYEYESSDGFHILSRFDYDLDLGLIAPAEDVLVSPNITVYQQVEDRQSFIVTCTDKMWSHRFLLYSPELSVISENNYSLELINSYLDGVSFYKVTVSPPVSFTCVREAHLRRNITKLQSDTYIFKQSGYPTIHVNKISVSDHHEEGVSSSYIGFVSFIAVGLIIMTAALIVTTIKSKAKEPTMRATNNDYEDA